MSRIFGLSRSRILRKRAAAALAAAGVMVMSSGLVLLNAPAASADGNNGTVKVQGQDMGGNGNDPQLPCTFDITWSGFDPHVVDATVSFSLQNPTDGADYALTSAGGKTSLSFLGSDGHSETYTPVISGTAKGQGYHVEIVVKTKDSTGTSIDKSKTFWIAACDSNPPTTNESGTLATLTYDAITACDTWGSITQPADKDNVSYAIEGGDWSVREGSHVVTATLTNGATSFTNASGWTVLDDTATRTVDLGTHTVCPAITGTLATLTYDAITACDTWGSITQPADTDNVSYAIEGGDWSVREGSYVVTATLTNGATSFTNTSGWAVHGDTATRTVDLGTHTTCPPPAETRTPVTTHEPTWVEATCTTDPSISYANDAGVTYKVVAGSVAPGSWVKVEATVAPEDQKDYYVATGTHTWWEHTFVVKPSGQACQTEAFPVQPTWREATCTTGSGITYHPATGVVYDADQAPAAGRTVTVTARAASADYFIAATTPSSWSHTFAAVPTGCSTDNPGNPSTDTPGNPSTDTPGNPSTDNPGSPSTDNPDNPSTDNPGTDHPSQGGQPSAKPSPSGEPEVLGTESTGPKPAAHTGGHKPSRAPTVLGTEAVAVPTAVDAGLATWPGAQPQGAGNLGLLARALLGGGLVLLLTAGGLGLGLRSRGGHEF